MRTQQQHAELKEKILGAQNDTVRAGLMKGLGLYLKEISEDIYGWWVYGQLYDTYGFEYEALECYERVIKANVNHLPEDERPYFFICYACMLKCCEHTEKAIKLLEHARNLFPDNMALAVFEAVFLYEEGEYKLSSKSFFDGLLLGIEDRQQSLRCFKRTLAGYRNRMET